jgi:hypothetical protein
MNAHRLFIVLALSLPSVVALRAPTAENDLRLTTEDKKYLDALMKDFLFDPQGAERVEITTAVRTVSGGAFEEKAKGWLVASKDGRCGLNMAHPFVWAGHANDSNSAA